ncbi:hypothetical protein C6I20_07995 [Aeromicrobium sp. A1-2]|uniref:DGQHR domain-containing protein DpdB n=1 Tax=Aeromicrobium sp. A1-2 TaxID=2107713 RepID=UPI000E46FC61|nr:DGQHR domain-containing protein DpdB [Aeromicrobium sp. A1-2]AXT85128.1 hypothetical protein C6I20_07995 [Aeromicrobium sp. A1-2]
MADRYVLQLPAVRIRQGSQYVYCFGVDGKRVHDFASISRVHREGEKLQGYQRPEVLSHIKAIRSYLESDQPLLPNAIVLAFDSRVRFEPTSDVSSVAYSTFGQLIIPVDESEDEADKPAWLVDGQQRSAAIRDADLGEFPMAAVGFIARNEEEQRSQFILVNNTKPLPKGLIHELLPDTIGHLPAAYAKKQLPAAVMIALNSGHGLDGPGPFAGRVATPTMPDGYIKDNSVIKMIENSLYDGALYQYRDPMTGTGDVEQMVAHLNYYWAQVRSVFPEAWELAPRKSRLTHGVGIQSLGYIMDSLTDGLPVAELAGLDIRRRIMALAPTCAWTTGTWNFGEDDRRRWNGLQNTPSDIRMLTNYLVRLL